jgi:hypothetical protein
MGSRLPMIRAALQEICDRLGPGTINVQRWLALYRSKIPVQVGVLLFC